MRIKYSPQRSDFPISYTFGTDTVIATVDGNADTFDFSALPDGVANEITSTLIPCPVLSAKRVSGELTVTLIRTHGPNPTESDRFPTDEVV